MARSTKGSNVAARPPVRAAATSGAESTNETEDHQYALVSVLYHALQGVQACDQYVKDAERGGDEELMKFFAESRAEQASRAERAKSLLVSRLEDDEDDEDD